MKITTLFPAVVGLAAGYVAGAAAGRGRYRQIVTKATELVQHPKVQQFAFDLAGKAKTNASRLPGPAAGVAGSAATRLQEYLTQPEPDGVPDVDLIAGGTVPAPEPPPA